MTFHIKAWPSLQLHVVILRNNLFFSTLSKCYVLHGIRKVWALNETINHFWCGSGTCTSLWSLPPHESSSVSGFQMRTAAPQLCGPSWERSWCTGQSGWILLSDLRPRPPETAGSQSTPCGWWRCRCSGVRLRWPVQHQTSCTVNICGSWTRCRVQAGSLEGWSRGYRRNSQSRGCWGGDSGRHCSHSSVQGAIFLGTTGSIQERTVLKLLNEEELLLRQQHTPCPYPSILRLGVGCPDWPSKQRFFRGTLQELWGLAVLSIRAWNNCFLSSVVPAASLLAR